MGRNSGDICIYLVILWFLAASLLSGWIYEGEITGVKTQTGSYVEMPRITFPWRTRVYRETWQDYGCTTYVA